MLTKIEIENFKSIFKETIELGRVNVFIGENGCGKTNILEAVGMASAYSEWKMSNDELALSGIRITKPSLTFSSFREKDYQTAILFKCFFDNVQEGKNRFIPCELIAADANDIYSKWERPSADILRESFDVAYEKTLHAPKMSESKLPDYPETISNQTLNTTAAENDEPFGDYKIFHLSSDVLRGIGGSSFAIPGIKGENLDLLIASLSGEEFEELINHSHFISWLHEIILDKEGDLRLKGHNLNLSRSKLYFRDKFMAKKNNIFSAENANEGILHILFYLALFISKRTPKFFAIDNIEMALNPYMCTVLMEELVQLAKKNDKQVLIATHSPTILDGLNLHDDEVRLFAVSRNLKGHTKVERIKLKPDAQVNGHKLKLSELWTRNYLGALPQHI